MYLCKAILFKYIRRLIMSIFRYEKQLKLVFPLLLQNYSYLSCQLSLAERLPVITWLAKFSFNSITIFSPRG